MFTSRLQVNTDRYAMLCRVGEGNGWDPRRPEIPPELMYIFDKASREKFEAEEEEKRKTEVISGSTSSDSSPEKSDSESSGYSSDASPPAHVKKLVYDSDTE